MNENSLEDTLMRVLSRYRDRLVFAYLFGSAAAGTAGPLSDIDLAVYLRDDQVPVYMDVKLALHADLCRALRSDDVDLVILNRTKNLMLLDAILRHGVVLVDDNPKLREDFELKVLHRAIDFRLHRTANLGV